MMLPTIVCIDDEPHNNEALERLLRKKYRLFSATQPLEGLELIRQHQPALIISDQRMPQMTGVELLKKSLDVSPDSVRLLLTGYTDLESVISAINEGQIYRYLTKPWEPNDVMMTIESAIDAYNMKQEIKRQNEELKSLDKLKTDFMILVTHELRTPLSGISSFVELLKEELKSDDHKTYISHIEKNTTRLKKLIEDILAITRLKTGSHQAPVSSVNLQKLISACWTATSREHKKKLDILVTGESLEVETHENLLKDALMRLFMNCYQHSVDEATVKVNIIDHPEKVIFTVSNPSSGSGDIPSQTLLSAFTKNENIMNHTQGTGLGLAIVHALTEALKGTLQVAMKNKVFTATISIPKKI